VICLWLLVKGNLAFWIVISDNNLVHLQVLGKPNILEGSFCFLRKLWTGDIIMVWGTCCSTVERVRHSMTTWQLCSLTRLLTTWKMILLVFLGSSVTPTDTLAIYTGLFCCWLLVQIKNICYIMHYFRCGWRTMGATNSRSKRGVGRGYD